jgi:hypothetical protein
MKCGDCPHFIIIKEPKKITKDLWDQGKAVCNKLNVSISFVDDLERIKKLDCFEKEVELELQEREKDA